MTARKIPEDAFARYVSMGVDRSYSALAKEYGVTKRAMRAVAETVRDRILTPARELAP